MQPFIELLLWSTLLAFLTAILYRFLTKPDEMRRLKKEMNEIRDRANKASKSGDTKEATKLTAEMMKSNSTVFKMNMKPMMVSMLLFIFVLGWLTGQYGGVTAGITNSTGGAFYGNFTYKGFTESFSVPFTATASQNNASAYQLTINTNGTQSTFHNGDEFTYAGTIWKVSFLSDNNKNPYVFFEALTATPFTIPFIGNSFNWFWWYFVVVIAGNFIFRKLLGVE